MKNFEDLTDGSDRIAVGNLRDAILKLKDKYGVTSTPILKEISDLLSRYEVSLAFELYKNNEKKQKTSNHVENTWVDQHTKISACKLLDSFIKRHPLSELSEKFNDSPLARDLAKRNDLWKTILITEKVYLQNITNLNDNYCKPIAMKLRSNKTLNDKQIKKIFQNFEDIKSVTQKLWKSLEAADKTKEPMIGKTFLENIKDIQHQYVNYIRGFSKALKQLIKIRNSSELVYSQAKVEIVDLIGSKEIWLPITSFLMLPLVRVQEYLMMIKELHLLTAGDNNNPDNACIQNVKDEFVKIGIELSLAKTDKLQKIGEVLSTLKGDIPATDYKALFMENLFKQLPAFIREGPINIITDKKKKDCYMFLFSSVMVIAEIVSTGEKHFDSYYSLKDVSVSDPRPPTRQVHHSFYVAFKNNERNVCLGGTTEAETLALNCDLRHLTDVELVTQRVPGPNTPEVQIEQAPPTFTNMLNQRTPGEDSVSPRRSRSRIIESDRFTLSLQVQKEKTEEGFCNQLPDTKVIRLSKTKENGILKGPDAEDARAPKVNEIAAARSITTLPPGTITGNTRMRSADRYTLVSWKNRLAVVVSDGQGQGPMTRVAEIAATTVIDNLKGETQVGIIDVKTAGRELLRSFALAHENILKHNLVYDSGSTSLLAGLLMETESDKIMKSPRPAKKRRTRWLFLTLSVGDCKAYHWCHQERAVKDIMNDTTGDGYHSGGRLGPQIFRNFPDLRDIHYNQCNCNEDDLIFVVTNGVYDNFDPENLGLSPRDSAILRQQPTMTNALDLPLKWSDMDPSKRKNIKSRFATDLFTKVLVESSEYPLTPRTAVSRIIDYCIQITQPAREYVENNLHKKPPKDKSQFLGVLDNTTCVCFEVKKSAPSPIVK